MWGYRKSSQPRHELPGTALPNSEDALDGLPVEIVGIQGAEFTEDGGNAGNPDGTRGHETCFSVYSTAGTRQLHEMPYMIRPRNPLGSSPKAAAAAAAPFLCRLKSRLSEGGTIVSGTRTKRPTTARPSTITTRREAPNCSPTITRLHCAGRPSSEDVARDRTYLLLKTGRWHCAGSFHSAAVLGELLRGRRGRIMYGISCNCLVPAVE